jgi:hypothetical protein
MYASPVTVPPSPKVWGSGSGLDEPEVLPVGHLVFVDVKRGVFDTLHPEFIIPPKFIGF